GTLHPYYLCHTKGCELRGKSLRRADVEGAFEDVLKGLRPGQLLLDVAKEMMKDAWEMRRRSVKAASKGIKASIVAIGAKIDKLMDRLVDAESPEMIAAYESKI
ncbi:MAG: recombinase, partial [Pseudomonadota bacterium]